MGHYYLCPLLVHRDCRLRAKLKKGMPAFLGVKGRPTALPGRIARDVDASDTTVAFEPADGAACMPN